MNAWTKLPGLDGRGNPRACCPPILAKAAMGQPIAVGFGSATVERDGEVMLDGERIMQEGDEPPTIADAEQMAAIDPDHDWRVRLYGPLHGEIYQRQAPNEWVLVEANEGFA